MSMFGTDRAMETKEVFMKSMCHVGVMSEDTVFFVINEEQVDKIKNTMSFRVGWTDPCTFPLHEA